MNHLSLSAARRKAWRFAVSVAAVAGLGVAGLAPATAAPASNAAHSAAAANPYSPTYGHPYRHGAVPTIEQNAKMKAWDAAHPASPTATGSQTLAYGGGQAGVGVTSGKVKVYVVFWGNQWGTQGTDGSGNLTFSNDSAGVAPVTQMMFKGLGTGGELWSASLTQWCDGSGVSSGATSCASSVPASQFVPYFSGGTLAGTWYDNSGAEPQTASGNQLGTEALAAAHHFGNTTSASNRYAYYVIVSPHGTNPDSYQGAYCAWHDWNGDSSLTGGAVSSDVGNFAFSNQPYNVDSGAGCGVGFMNSPGTLDGYTMTLGHEFGETMSDQFPAGGWTNASSGQENGDECAWIKAGQPGGAAEVTMGNGSYVEQALWSNDDNRCDISHPILNHGTTDTVTVNSIGSQSWTVNSAVSVQASGSSSAGKSLTWSATGLPAGVSINSSTGLVSGTPTTAGSGTATVTASDSTPTSGSTNFSWTVASSGGGCTAAQLIANGGFENGTAPWTGTTGAIVQPSFYGGTAHTGNYAAWLDGYGYPATDTLAQSVTIPATCKNATFSFWRNISTQEFTSTNIDDTLKVQVLNSAGTVLATLHTYSNLDADNVYDQASFSLNQFIGQQVTLKFTGSETDADFGTTNFLLDDVALNVN